MALRQGTNPVSVAPIFPAHTWRLGSLAILSDRFYLAVSVVLLTVVLAGVFRFTRFGLLTRATADSQEGAFVTGVSPDRVALLNWMLSAAVAGAAGILIAPISPVTPISYTLFVVPALAAALVGGFSSLVVTVVAGLAIGMLQAEAINLASQQSWMPHTGSAELVPLIVILVALLVTGRGIPARGDMVRHPLGRAPRPRGTLVPLVAGTRWAWSPSSSRAVRGAARVIGTFIAGTIALSLVVVTGYAGQVSVAQLTLAGVGAFTLSGLTTSWDVPFPFAPLLAALFATAVGVVIGLPALRLRGLTLGVVTLAFAYAIEAVWFRNTQIVDGAGDSVSHPKLFGWNLGIGAGDCLPPPVVRPAVPGRARPRGIGSSPACAELARLGDARGAGERALGRRPRRQRRAGQGGELRHRVVRRRPRRQPARLPPRRGHVRLVHRARWAHLAVDRLPRRRHVGVGRRARRRPGVDRHRVRSPRRVGPPRPVVRHPQRCRPDPDADLQPGGPGPLGPRAGGPDPGSTAAPAPRDRRRRPCGRCRGPATGWRPGRAGRRGPARRARPRRPVRGRGGRRRALAAGPARTCRRADRPQRRRQDQRHRRASPASPAPRARWCWPAGTCRARRPTSGSTPAWLARSSRSSCTTTSASRRT